VSMAGGDGELPAALQLGEYGGGGPGPRPRAQVQQVQPSGGPRVAPHLDGVVGRGVRHQQQVHACLVRYTITILIPNRTKFFLFY
jgi:hypothetical protein